MQDTSRGSLSTASSDSAVVRSLTAAARPFRMTSLMRTRFIHQGSITPGADYSFPYIPAVSTSSSAAFRSGFIKGRDESRSRFTISGRLLSISRFVRSWPGERS